MPETVKIDSLTPDEHNANAGTERGRYMLDHSLRQYGAGRSILIDKHGRVIAGNKTLEAAADIGLENVEIVHTTGKRLIAVQRDDLDLETDPEARELAYADNRTSEVGFQLDAAQFKLDIDAGLDLSWGWMDGELLELGVGEDPPDDPGPQVDKAAELQEKWQVQRGQVWQVGQHRVMCGDSTSAEDVARLMGGERATMVMADPPFGISYTGHGKSKDGRANKFKPIVGDETPNADWLQLCILEYGAIYLKTHWDVLEFWKTSVAKVAKVKSIIVWDRCSHSAGDVMGGYATQSELLIFGVFDNHKINSFDTDVWRIERATTGAPGHPYESPVNLPKRAIENSTRIDDICLDPFTGSGTTLVACEQIGRIGYGMEIEPKYVAVTLERLTGMGLEALVCE